MHRFAKRVALLSVVVGMVVAVSLAVLSWDRILEEWYIHRLSSDDEAVQLHAAEKLVALDSARSIPTLAELVARSETEAGYIAYPLPPGGLRPRVRAVEASENGAPPTDRAPTRVFLTPLAHCLFRIGLNSCDGSTDLVRTTRVNQLLPAHGYEDNEALTSVRTAWCFPETPVERKSPKGIKEAKAEDQRQRMRRRRML